MYWIIAAFLITLPLYLTAGLWGYVCLQQQVTKRLKIQFSYNQLAFAQRQHDEVMRFRMNVSGMNADKQKMILDEPESKINN